MAPVLAALSGLYARYVNEGPVQRRRIIQPIITFDNVLHNMAFLLSHLTNQGTCTYLIKLDIDLIYKIFKRQDIVTTCV